MSSHHKIKVHDVGHGLSIHIRTLNNRQIVIDMGANDGYSPLAYFSLLNTIDLLIITHPHKDHIRDIDNLNQTPINLNYPEGLNTEDLINQARLEDKNLFCKYKKLVTLLQASPHYSSSMHPKWWGGLDIKIFRAYQGSCSNLNNLSSITTLSFEGRKVVICGDNEYESIQKLLGQYDFRRAVSGADILIAPHHGRASGFHSDFVNLVSPKLTIISDTSKVDTSAQSRYSALSKGMQVYNCDKHEKCFRKCLSTRNDGSIEILLKDSLEVFI